MIQDSILARAVAAIRQRSDRQEDSNKLVSTFVDVGILLQVDNPNHHIIYGRRGTGKTHILRVLEHHLKKRNATIPIYIDARVLGSTSQFTDTKTSLKQRCICLFRDILGEVCGALQSESIENPPPESNAIAVLELINDLTKVATEPVIKYGKGSIEQRTLNKGGSSYEANFSLNTSDPSLKLGAKNDKSHERENTTSRTLDEEDKVIFPTIADLTKQILKKSGTSMYILIDEWSSLPRELQPYLAEFLKRSFLPIPEITVKIAALEFRSQFNVRNSTKDIIGFELGSDIPTLDVDDYYVYDKSPDEVANAFADMLFKHLTNELPTGYLRSKYSIQSKAKLIDKMFGSFEVFAELSRASEGVVRDLINIFAAAYFNAHRKGKETIEKRAVIAAAGEWFEQDKKRNLDDVLRAKLQLIVGEVVSQKKARSFLIPQKLERNITIQQLVDARVLHLVRRGYVDPQSLGLRYNIYTLDYGTYVDQIEAGKAPDGFFVFGDFIAEDLIVPFKDQRGMKKVILPDGLLK